jgi:hypothetical protein
MAVVFQIEQQVQHWEALGRLRHDDSISPHNNHLENLLRPWAVGRTAWLSRGSELAGQRVPIVLGMCSRQSLTATTRGATSRRCWSGCRAMKI